MKKNITEIKRNLVERLLTALHRDYNECTIYTPGIEAIVPGANAITIKRLVNYDYKTNKTSLRYKLHVVTINDANHYDWETTVAKFDTLDPDTREKLERFINAKCDNAPAADMPTTFVGHAYYYTLEGGEGGEKENTKSKNNKAMKTTNNATIFENIHERGYMTGKEMLLLKSRSNKAQKDLFNYDLDADGYGIKLVEEWANKGLNWLKSLIKRNGEPKAGQNLGYREIEIIKTAQTSDFTFVCFFDAGNRFYHNYLPVYNVAGMEYYVNGGFIQVVG